jgi:hypothetical protein
MGVVAASPARTEEDIVRQKAADELFKNMECCARDREIPIPVSDFDVLAHMVQDASPERDRAFIEESFQRLSGIRNLVLLDFARPSRGEELQAIQQVSIVFETVRIPTVSAHTLDALKGEEAVLLAILIELDCGVPTSAPNLALILKKKESEICKGLATATMRKLAAHLHDGMYEITPKGSITVAQAG